MFLPRLTVLALALPLVATPVLRAQDANPWLVRARAIAIVPNASSTPGGLDVRPAATLEVDISRRLTPFLSAELILATASHDVRGPSGSLGSVTHLPPTLLLQLHPLRTGAFRPYLGAGANVTFFYNKAGGVEPLSLSTSFGYAGQAGFDYYLSPRAVFNVDAKYIRIATDVRSGGTLAYALRINPFVVGVGFGYRF